MCKGNVAAMQFHPEKSGRTGVDIFTGFLANFAGPHAKHAPLCRPLSAAHGQTTYCRRIIACLDVRQNDQNEVVVTKGDQYNVRLASTEKNAGQVRNLGDPVVLAERYYEQGADEITILNITGYRNPPLKDNAMVKVRQLTTLGLGSLIEDAI